MLLALALAFRIAQAEDPIVLETPPEVQLTAEGDIYVRIADGSLERIPHASILSFEAWCDAVTCDLVLRTAERRVAVGSRPSGDADVIFERPVVRSEGRLSPGEPRRTGMFSAEARAPERRWTLEVHSGAKSSVGRPILDRFGHFYLHCLDRRNPGPDEKVSIKVVVSAAGLVTSTEVEPSSPRDPEFTACVVQQLEGFVFLPSEGVTLV